MPKKEEIQEKKDQLNNEKISEKKVVKQKKESKDTKKVSTKKNEKMSEKKVDSKTTNKSRKTTTKKEDIKVSEVEKTDKTSNLKNEKTKKVVKIEAKKEIKNQIDELSVIEKIKNFIAKIAAMQEEARKESLEELEKQEKKSTKGKTKTAKETSKDKDDKKTKYMLEYYDLPYRYNETIVKILAQTPKRMFVYWDISDNDREKYIKTFGEDFFEKTYPVLLLYNEDKKYIREIPINDFANSWYIDIQEPKTKYSIQLGRKFKTHDEIVNINMQKVQENSIILHTDYLPIANSNLLELPNDHVLLEDLPSFITFRNVITNEETMIELKKFRDVFGNNYDIKEFYEEYYKEEISEGIFDMANPSSNLSSSSFK